MADQDTLKLTTDLISADFSMERPEGDLDEEALIRLLATHIDRMLEGRFQTEQLMSNLYRLDVREDLVRAAFHPGAPEPVALGLARLIWERQRQRAYTKLHIRTEPLDEDMEW